MAKQMPISQFNNDFLVKPVAIALDNQSLEKAVMESLFKLSCGYFDGKLPLSNTFAPYPNAKAVIVRPSGRITIWTSDAAPPYPFIQARVFLETDIKTFKERANRLQQTQWAEVNHGDIKCKLAYLGSYCSGKLSTTDLNDFTQAELDMANAVLDRFLAS